MTPPRALTEKCTRHDCRIESHGASMTLSARVPTYDKHGKPINEHDNPNVVTAHYFCATCRKRWNVAKQTGQPDKIEMTEPTA